MLKLLGIIAAVVLIADVAINQKQIIKSSWSLLVNLWTKAKSLIGK